MRSIQIVFYIASVGLVRSVTIPPVPIWPPGKCIDKSLSIPSWIIRDFKSTVQGSATFSVTNRASDTSGSVRCASSTCTVSGNAALSVSISSGSGNPIVTLKEAWVCNDNDLERDIHFQAAGSTVITSLENGVSPIPYLAYGSLSGPIPLTPAQPTPPPGYNLSTCADISKSPLWTVSGISFQNYTKGQCRQWYFEDLVCIDPGTPFQPKGLFLNVTVTNEAIKHTIACSLTLSNDPRSLPSTPTRCVGGQFNEIALDITWRGTAPQFGITVDQLWYCLENPDENVKPTVLIATGKATPPLSCKSTPGITGAADDIITTCTQPTAFKLGGSLVKREVEPEFALVTAPATSDGCTVESVVNPTWTLIQSSWQTKFVNSTTDPNQSLWVFSTGLRTPGFNERFYGFVGEKHLPGAQDPATWYNCEWGVPGDWLPWTCQFQFNYHTRELGLKQIWECKDKDPAHPLFWNAAGTITFPNEGLNCAWDNPNIITCYYSDGGFRKTWPVPHVEVKTTNVEPPRPH